MTVFLWLGETIEEITFSDEEGLDENLEKDWATDAEQAKSEMQDESEHRSIMSKRWTLELRQWIQILRSKSKLMQQHKQINLNTYSRDSRPAFYKRGCSFTLVLMYRFVSPFVNQKNKTLILFQDFLGGFR